MGLVGLLYPLAGPLFLKVDRLLEGVCCFPWLG